MNNGFIKQAKLPKEAYENLDIKEVLGSYQNKEKRRWCRTHLTSKWLINPKTGLFYLKCSKGYNTDDKCIPGD